MHSSLVRLQNAFGFSTSVAIVVSVMVLLSSFLVPQNPSGSVELNEVQVVKGYTNYRYMQTEELAHIKFDLDIDLSSLFNWNTKQIYFYVKAVYPSRNRKIKTPNEAVIWDAIIPSRIAPWHQNYRYPDEFGPASSSASGRSKRDSEVEAQILPPPSSSSFSGQQQPGVLSLRGQLPKYKISDPSGVMANRRDVKLELGWNVQPWVGALWWRQPKDFGAWKAMVGGQSEKFDFPDVRRGAKAKAGTVQGREENRGPPV